MNYVLSKKRIGSSALGKNCTPIRHIPSPVIGDILSHLPLKNVIQSKIICKEWENLISGPDFAKFHFSKSPRGLFLYSEISGNVLHFVDLTDSSLRFKFCGDVYIPQKAIVGRFLSTKIEFGKCFISSCNGFLFLCETNPHPRYYICNPITRDYLKIPPLSDMCSNNHLVNWRSEFGFSPKTGQYKVLRMRFSYKRTAKIFTLGQKSWRSIQIPINFNPYGTTTFLHGTFHWLSLHDTVLSFDVGDETFHEFSFPPNNDDLDYVKSTPYCDSLGVLDECISLCRANHVEGCIEIWVLKKYGVMESWVKEFVIYDVRKFTSDLRVLWFMEDGEKGKNVLFVCTQSTVVTYDRLSGVCNYRKVEGLWDSFTLFPHIPSLTPLKDVIKFEENSEDVNEEMSREWSIFPKARHMSDIWRPHPLNPLQDDNEEMSPERRKFPKMRLMSDIMGQHPFNPYYPLPENLSNHGTSQLGNFLGEASNKPSSSANHLLDENSKYEDENEVMSPERRKFHKVRLLSDILGQYPSNPSNLLYPPPPPPGNSSNHPIIQLGSFFGETSSNPSSSTQLPSYISLELAVNNLRAKIEKRETGEHHMFGKFFLDWAEEVRAMTNPSDDDDDDDDDDDEDEEEDEDEHD